MADNVIAHCRASEILGVNNESSCKLHKKWACAANEFRQNAWTNV